MRRIAIVIFIVSFSIASIGIFSSVVVADEWPDECYNGTEIGLGEYSGELTPSDTDYFILDLSEGDSIAVEFSYDKQSGAEGVYIFGLDPDIINKSRYYDRAQLEEEFEPYESVTGDVDRYSYDHDVVSFAGENIIQQSFWITIQNEHAGEHGRVRNYARGAISVRDETASFWMYAETSNRYCIGVKPEDDSEGAGTWTISMSQRNHLTPTASPTSTPSPIPTPSPTSSLNDKTLSQTATLQDSDGDGVPDSDDYAPNDPSVQQKSDLTDTTNTSDSDFLLWMIIGLLLVIIFVLLWK